MSLLLELISILFTLLLKFISVLFGIINAIAYGIRDADDRPWVIALSICLFFSIYLFFKWLFAEYQDEEYPDVKTDKKVLSEPIQRKKSARPLYNLKKNLRNILYKLHILADKLDKVNIKGRTSIAKKNLKKVVFRAFRAFKK